MTIAEKRKEYRLINILFKTIYGRFVNPVILLW